MDFSTTRAAVQPIKNMTVIPSHTRLITSRYIRGIPTGHVGGLDTIGFCESGIGILHINGENVLVRPNQLVLSPKDTWRARTGLSDTFSLNELCIFGDISGQNIFDYLQLSTGNYVVDVPPKFLPRIKEIYGFFSPTPYIEDYLFRVSGTAELIGIYFHARVIREENEQVFQPVLDFMDAHISENSSLSELASIMHMTPNYFIAAFKKRFMLSPIAYYNTLRAKKAMDLLADTDMTLSEIGKAIGIEDRYYFSNFFKAQCGIAPDYFRKSIRNILAAPGHEMNRP